MEFILVPLLAIAAATFGIYKLMALLFHIRLSRNLLLLLAGFAWLISMVLPGLFFQTAGFVGSVGVSLASALCFAWIATAFESKKEAVEGVSVSDADVESENAPLWTPLAESAFSAIPRDGAELNATEAFLPKEMESSYEPLQTALLEQQTDAMVVENIASVSAALLVDNDNPKPEIIRSAALPESLVEPFADSSVEILVDSSRELEVRAPLQPESDSLEDLLEFAFSQRTIHNDSEALETFRLIRSLYGDREAVPLVMAEIVSSLQSQGRYDEAVEELTDALNMPVISSDARLVGTFEQKLAYILALQDVLAEHGATNIPIEQIPAEWNDLLEQRLLSVNRVQS